MNNDQQVPAAGSTWGRLKWPTTAVVALAMAGLAYQLGGQPQMIAEAGVTEQAQSVAGVPYSPAAGTGENRGDQPQQSAGKTPEYCPTDPTTGLPSRNSACALFQGSGIVDKLRAVVLAGASVVAPAFSFAQHCLSYIR